jgi:type II secretory pathway component PulL
MATFFPTSTPVAEETLRESFDRQAVEIVNLKQQVATLDNLREHWQRQYNEAQQKIDNVKGYFFDLYSENGEIEDEIQYIAELLDIVLMKQIAGTSTCEISWTAMVPLNFDAEDMEISFDVNCDSDEADDFEWHEESVDTSGEDV